MKVHPAICMKTHSEASEAERPDPKSRTDGAIPSASGSEPQTPHSCHAKMKVHPAISMKTQNEASDADRPDPKSRRHGAIPSASDSEPQTPHSCHAKMKVHPAILMKTKDRENLHCEIGAKFGAEETKSHAEGLSEETKRRTCTPLPKRPEVRLY
jgi:hypothetical protein